MPLRRFALPLGLSLFTVVCLALGYRWQVVPLGLATLFALGWSLVALPRWARFVSAAVVALLVLASAVAMVSFPVFSLPAPTGPHGVGVRYLTVVTDRPELFTSDSADRRVLYVKIWYPATPHPDGKRAKYLEGGPKGVNLLARLAELPAFALGHFEGLTTAALVEAPVAAGAFPLLTFSHGYGSWFGQNTVLAEKLASNGFVVASIAHSYQTEFAATSPDSIVEFPEVVALQDSAAERADDESFDKTIALRDTLLYRDSMGKMIARGKTTNSFARIWGDDVKSVISRMIWESNRSGGPFFGSIDSSNIGSFGMSFGGAASAQAALGDRRIKAAINMDGLQSGDWITDTMRVPFLFLESERSPYFYLMNSPLKPRTTAELDALIFLGSEHWNFTDVNLFSPLFQWLGVLGKTDRHVMQHELDEVVIDYFRSHLVEHRPFDATKHLEAGKLRRAAY